MIPRFYLLNGIRLIFHPKFRNYLLITTLINIVLYGIAIFAALHYSEPFLERLPSWLIWIAKPIIFIFLTTLAYFLLTLLTTLLTPAFYPLLVHKAFRYFNTPRFSNIASSQNLFFNLTTAFKLSISKILYIGLLALITFLITLIPLVNSISPLLWPIFGAWCLAMEFLSYPLEELNFSFNAQKQFLRNHRIESLIFGATIMLALAVPILNLIIPASAVLAACNLVVGTQEFSNSLNSIKPMADGFK